MTRRSTLSPSVLFFIQRLGGGGAERAAAEVVTHLAHTDFDVKMLLGEIRGEYLSTYETASLLADDQCQPRSPLADLVHQKLVSPVLASYRVRKFTEERPARKLLDSLNLPSDGEPMRCARQILLSNYYKRMRSAIIRNRPDILVTSLMETGSAIAYAVLDDLGRRARRMKWIAIEQNNTLARLEDYYPLEEQFSFWQRMTKLVYSRPDAIVAVSNGVAGGLVKNFDTQGSRIITIENPVDVRAVREAPPRLWPRPFVMTSGRLHTQKQFDHLIRAFALSAGKADYDLLIFGTGTLESELRKLTERLGVADRVVFQGFSTEVWGYMKSARCFVLSSKYEGCPLVLLEAMAASCPVVSYDCDFGPRELISDKKSGLLVPYGDVNELSNAMLKCVCDVQYATKLRAVAGREAERFDSQCIAQRFSNLFNEMLSSRRVAS